MKCIKCDHYLVEGQKFCPNCGSAVEKATIKKEDKKITNKWVVISAILITLIAGVFLFSKFGKINVKEILVNRTNIELEIGENAVLKYEIIPDNASDKSLIWESSDKSVATVTDRGQIFAKNEGVTNIMVSSKNGKTAVCSVTVEKPRISFGAIYTKIGGSLNDYIVLSSDNSSIQIDTNPSGIDNFTSPMAISMIEKLHKELELPDSIYNKMMQTRALDGRQSETHGDIIISWTYHPDNGLDIIYENLRK